MKNIKCPKCQKFDCVKEGFVRKKQRYKCNECKFRHTVQFKKEYSEGSTRRQSLQLYLEGLGFRSIGRILKYSHVSIYNWIRSYGSQLKSLRNTSEVKQVEMDEMHTYVSKKTINGYGYLLIELGKDSLISLLDKEI